MTINIRRVVTGHDANGKAIVRIDDGCPRREWSAAYDAAAHLDDQ